MIYKDYQQLNLIPNARISRSRFYEIAEICSKYGAEKKIAFSALYYHKKRNKMLLKEYMSLGYISFSDYLFSYIYQTLIPLPLSFVKVILKKDIKVFRIKKRNYRSDRLTFSAGVQRLLPESDGNKIKDIQIFESNLTGFVFIKLRAFLLGIFYGVNNIHLLIQYLIFSKDLKTMPFNNTEFIIEEARNPIQLIFVDLIKDRAKNIKIYFRGIPTLYRYYFGFDVVVTNIIAFNVYKKYNTKVKITKQYAIDLMNIKNLDNNNTVGFLADIGRAGINFSDKERTDDLINKISKKNRISFSISIHELDRGVEKGYYKNKFTSSFIKFRDQELFEDYLNNISILVGRVSTGIYQAFLAKKPIIILDLINDKPMKEFVDLTEGLIQYAYDEKSLLEKYYLLINLNAKEKQTKFEKAISNLKIIL